MRGRRRRAVGVDRKPERCRALRGSGQRAAPGPERDGGGDAARRRTMAEQDGRAIATASPFSVATSGVSVSSRAKNAGDSAFTSTCAGSAERQPHQRARGGRGVGGGERAVFEQQPHDRLAEHDQAERRRQRQPDASSSPRDCACAIAPRSLAAHAARHLRESAPCPWRRRRCRAAVRSGRLAKYSHDTADGDDEAMMAPATNSNCGRCSRSCPAPPWR